MSDETPGATIQTVLIAEDEPVLRESVAALLEEEGFRVLQAGDGRTAADIMLQEPADLLISDVRMPEMNGIELLARARQIAPETPVLIITAYGTVDDAVSAMRAGAWDYVLKPVKFDDLLVRIRRALHFRDVSRQQRVMSEQMAESASFHEMVSQSPRMLELFDQVRKLSIVKSNVLIMGESGTGKELFARAIHYNGSTRGKPFIPINCGAIPDSLVESELFGHRRGAFTGAVRDKPGYFETACGGTLFLDEISAFPFNLQSSLLRAVEERAIVPVGDTRPRSVDVRIIAASNQDLRTMVKEGAFREDLYYRLNVAPLTIPPLRERKVDIPLLVQHFVDRYAKQMNHQIYGATNGVMRALLEHDWPGNVRELENVIERAIIFVNKRKITVDDLPFPGGDDDDDSNGDDLREALRQFERQHIVSCLRRHDGDKAAAAQSLGVAVSTLYRKLEELDIPKIVSEED